MKEYLQNVYHGEKELKLNNMKITRKSQVSGIERTLDINITEEQLKRWESGEFIQRVAPHLTDNEREFIMSGITQEEWDNAFPEEDDKPFSEDEDGNSSTGIVMFGPEDLDDIEDDEDDESNNDAPAF